MAYAEDPLPARRGVAVLRVTLLSFSSQPYAWSSSGPSCAWRPTSLRSRKRFPDRVGRLRLGDPVFDALPRRS